MYFLSFLLQGHDIRFFCSFICLVSTDPKMPYLPLKHCFSRHKGASHSKLGIVFLVSRLSSRKENCSPGRKVHVFLDLMELSPSPTTEIQGKFHLCLLDLSPLESHLCHWCTVDPFNEHSLRFSLCETLWEQYNISKQQPWLVGKCFEGMEQKH